MLQLLSGNPRTVDALGFLLAFALTALMDSVFHDKLPHDHGRAFAVNGELSKGKARGSGLIFVLCIALVTLAVVVLIFRVLLQLAYVPSGSMETTIPTKCLLIGWRLPYVVSDPVPDRGDIVTFWDEELNKVLVKRVVGLPGETLSFKNGYTYVNGEKLDESYLPTQGITTLPDSMADKIFTVPEGCMFVMGDNRTGSNDSRLLGEPYIPVEAVQARMLVAISVGSDQSWQGVRWIG